MVTSSWVTSSWSRRGKEAAGSVRHHSAASGSDSERRRVVDVALVDDLAVAPRLPGDLVHPVLLPVRRGVVEDPVDDGVVAFDEVRHEGELERLERPVER